jgi:type IV pilus assembly protein PilA
MKKVDGSFRIGQKGFTLIELLVVIAILGILAAVAIPNLSRLMNKGRTESSLTELSIVQTCVVAYMEDNGGVIEAAAGVTGTGGILDFYIDTPLHGIYAWDDTGHVTQTDYP